MNEEGFPVLPPKSLKIKPSTSNSSYKRQIFFKDFRSLNKCTENKVQVFSS